MARHDYDLPPDWNAMTDDERCTWLTQERCRRRALRQDTAFARKARKAIERRERRLKARPGTVDLADHR